MRQPNEQALSPVNHYELLGIPSEANQQLIRQKSRLLIRAWNNDEAIRWVSDSKDLIFCKMIHERIEVAFKTLSDESSRVLYDTSLAHPVTNETEVHFRLIWDRVIKQYQPRLSLLRLLPTATPPANYQQQWGNIPKHLLRDLFKWVNKKDSGRLPIVSKETNAAMTESDLQRYCDFVNEQNMTFSGLVTETIAPLTIATLKNHWVFSDELKQLFNVLLKSILKEKTSDPKYQAIVQALQLKLYLRPKSVHYLTVLFNCQMVRRSAANNH